MKYDNEYKERAYQWWKTTMFKERGFITAQMCEALRAIMGEEDLITEFYERYDKERESERDSLEKIRADASHPIWHENPTPGDWQELMLDLINRTVAVMERDLG